MTDNQPAVPTPASLPKPWPPPEENRLIELPTDFVYYHFLDKRSYR